MKVLDTGGKFNCNHTTLTMCGSILTSIAGFKFMHYVDL